jgi:hypothetical protein
MKPVLEEAHECVFNDREQIYGAPGKNLRVVASFWEEYLHARGYWNDDAPGMTAQDVCYMMALLKIARLANDPAHHDSQVDACGYIALADRVQNAR